MNPINAANKAKAPAFSIKRRYLLVIPLILAVHLTFSYSRLAKRLYFPFERWPAGRAKHAMPLPGPRLTETQAMFRNLTEGVVVRYMRFHKRNRFNPNARKLIYTGNGNKNGFGDRFRGILYSYHLALLTQRVLLLDWQDPFPLDLVFESARGVSVFYDPRIDQGPLPDLTPWRHRPDPFYTSETSAKPLPFCGCTLQQPEILLSREKAVVVRSENYPTLAKLRDGLRKHSNLPAAKELRPVVEAWYQRRDGTGLNGAIFSLIFRALLRPAPQLIERLARMRGELRAIVPPRLRAVRKGQSRGYISVHARIGHGVGEGHSPRFNLAHLRANLSLIAACLAKAAAEEAEDADLPEPQMFYLATDTPEFASVFRREIGRWSKRARVEGIGGKVTHSAKMRDASPSEREGFINTGADLFFLSAGERLVSLKSGFSNLAKYLGDTPHKVLLVDKCVQNAESLKLQQPSEQNLLLG